MCGKRNKGWLLFIFHINSSNNFNNNNNNKDNNSNINNNKKTYNLRFIAWHMQFISQLIF